MIVIPKPMVLWRLNDSFEFDENQDFKNYSLHLELVYDSNGYTTEKNYYKTIDAETEVYSDIAVKVNRVLSSWSTDKKQCAKTIEWYLDDNTIGHIKNESRYYNKAETAEIDRRAVQVLADI